MQILPPGATLQDATEWLRSCGVIANAAQAATVPTSSSSTPLASTSTWDLSSTAVPWPHVRPRLPLFHVPASLRTLQKALPAIEAHHGTLVSISPEPPNSSSAVAEEDGLGFDLLLTTITDWLIVQAHVPATGAGRRLVRSSRPRRPATRDAIGLDPCATYVVDLTGSPSTSSSNPILGSELIHALGRDHRATSYRRGSSR